jgi:hypothetical protein
MPYIAAYKQHKPARNIKPKGGAMAKSTKRIAFGAYQPSAFRIP